MSRSSEVAALRMLFQRMGDWVQVAELFEPGVDEAEAQKFLLPYLEAGYPIQIQGDAVRLLPPGDVWCAEEILARIGQGSSGLVWDPVVLAVTHSTNDVVREAALRGNAAGLVVVASEQTAGRGRAGRTWHSPPHEGLYASILLRPQEQARTVGRLGITVGVAVADAVESVCGVRPTLKWPNDLLMRNKKMSGILVETELAGNGVGFAVVGVGINIRSQTMPDELKDRATSLYIETGILYRRVDVLLALLASLDQRLTHSFDDIKRDWEAACPAIGERIELRNGDVGTAIGLDSSGALLLKTDSGEVQAVYGAEVQ